MYTIILILILILINEWMNDELYKVRKKVRMNKLGMYESWILMNVISATSISLAGATNFLYILVPSCHATSSIHTVFKILIAKKNFKFFFGQFAGSFIHIWFNIFIIFEYFFGHPVSVHIFYLDKTVDLSINKNRV